MSDDEYQHLYGCAASWRDAPCDCDIRRWVLTILNRSRDTAEEQ